MVHKLPLSIQNIVKTTNTNPSMIEIIEKDKKEVELKIKGSTRLGKYESLIHFNSETDSESVLIMITIIS